MDYLRKQKRLQALYNIGCLCMGVLADILFFYLSICTDTYLNTFEDASLHVITIPILFSILFIYLECRFLSESVKPDLLFIVGNLIGITFIFNLTFKIENFNNFNVDDYILYNLIRYFTPFVVFLMANICNALIRNLIYQYRIASYIHSLEIQKLIEELDRDREEHPEKYVVEETSEEKKDILEVAHKHIGKLSDIIGKSIDPDYKRDDTDKKD